MNCSKCNLAGEVGSMFCEACGEPFPAAAEVRPAKPASPGGRGCSCGATSDKIIDNVCTLCGEMIEEKKPRDHFDIRIDEFRAAESDLGLKHWRNEDCVAMAVAGTATLVVVSDGVSSSEHPDEASQGAVNAAVEALRTELAAGTEREAAVLKAIDAAQTSVINLPYSTHSRKEPPEATLVVLLIQDGLLNIGWVGDSRAYSVQNGEATLLTQDHSWINEVVNAGLMPLEEALKDRRAHAVTQSLGRLPDGEVLEPSVKTVPLDGIDYVLGCSDGFWNYAHLQQDKPPEGINALFATPEAEALTIARNCVNFANNQGGHDNITVAVVALSAMKGPGPNDNAST